MRASMHRALTLFIAASKSDLLDGQHRPPAAHPQAGVDGDGLVFRARGQQPNLRLTRERRQHTALVRVGHVDDVGDVELVELLQDRLRRNRKRDGFRLDHAADVTHLPAPDVVRRIASMSGQNGQSPVGALLVGSVPLSSADAVFRTIADLLGSHVRRMPDGETGERTYWMVFSSPPWPRIPRSRRLRGAA